MSAKEMPIEDELKLQVIELVSEERELIEQENEIMQANPKLGEFLKRQKEFANKSALFYKTIEDQMIQNSIKSIKGPWGSLTIAERTNYKSPDIEEVPPRFIKKALDTTKVGAEFKLKGKLPKGVESSQTLYLTKRIKLDAPIEEV